MEDFLTSAVFRYAVFPIASMAIGVWIRFESSHRPRFKKEDMAIGLDLLRTALLMFVLLTSDRAFSLVSTNRAIEEVLAAKSIDYTDVVRLHARALSLSNTIATSGWIIFLMFLSLWVVSGMVHRYGWKSKTKMTIIVGIILPLIVGILGLIAVMRCFLSASTI